LFNYRARPKRAERLSRTKPVPYSRPTWAIFTAAEELVAVAPPDVVAVEAEPAVPDAEELEPLPLVPLIPAEAFLLPHV
jgi:hypothetical protein